MRRIVLPAIMVLLLTVAASTQSPQTQPTGIEQGQGAKGQTPQVSRNLFLAPEQIRKARTGTGKRQGQIAPPTSLPPGLMPPPPEVTPPPQVPLPSLPPGFTPTFQTPPEGTGPSGMPATQKKPEVIRPELLGVVGGGRPQAILEHGGNVVVAHIGAKTPWGKVLKIEDGKVTLQTKSGRMELKVYVEGVK